MLRLSRPGSSVTSMRVCECDQIMKKGIGLISPVFVQGANVCPTATARAEVSSRALACGGVVMAPRLWVGEGASWLLGEVIVGVDRPLGLPRAQPCWLVVLGGPMSPWG